MKNDRRTASGRTSVGDPGPALGEARASARRALNEDQTSADADQSASDADQTASDADQTVATTDQASADRDQRASDTDQATADREHASNADPTAADERAYDASRHERQTGSFERRWARLMRNNASGDREGTASFRDRTATIRDSVARQRDASAVDLARADPEASLQKEFDELRAKAAADRARAAADRSRATKDRTKAALERARLEAELQSAHLDDLTGAYRREAGRLALSNEIDRARRSNGQFVLAFVDVDRLKVVNDRDGHAAGDRALQAVADAIRFKLRSFDPLVRYGGDEFLCGLGGTNLTEAGRRFTSIASAIEADANVGISVGLVALADGDSLDELTERADAAMLQVKAQHHARPGERPTSRPQKTRSSRPSRDALSVA
jgi:diguanylate cyclase (GGDEF)-like protein